MASEWQEPLTRQVNLKNVKAGDRILIEAEVLYAPAYGTGGVEETAIENLDGDAVYLSSEQIVAHIPKPKERCKSLFLILNDLVLVQCQQTYDHQHRQTNHSWNAGDQHKSWRTENEAGRLA